MTPIAQLIAELRGLAKVHADEAARMWSEYHCSRSRRNPLPWMCRQEEDRAALLTRAAEALADYQAVRDERDTLASNYTNLLADTSGEIAGLRSALARQEELLAEAGKVVEPFAAKLVDIGSDEEDEDSFQEMSFANRRAKTITVGHFRAAARLSDKLKADQ